MDFFTKWLSFTRLWACVWGSFNFFGWNLIICNNYNWDYYIFQSFKKKKKKNLRVWCVLWVCGWNNFFINPYVFFFFSWSLENVVIPNYNFYKLLTFTQKNRKVPSITVFVSIFSLFLFKFALENIFNTWEFHFSCCLPPLHSFSIV